MGNDERSFVVSIAIVATGLKAPRFWLGASAV